MARYCQLLSRIAPVVAFDYDYMAAGKKRPDPMTRLLERHRQELETGRKKYGPRAVLIGKSMGGRVGCHLALEEDVLGVVCLGYPLVGMQKTAKMRDQVLLDLDRPALFVQGTRDRLCPLDSLRTVLAKRSAPSELHVVESGNHSLEPTKTHLKQTGISAEALEEQTLAKIKSFVAELSSRKPTPLRQPPLSG